MTAQPSTHARFRRAIERRALWMAEDAARELSNLPLEDALQPAGRSFICALRLRMGPNASPIR